MLSGKYLYLGFLCGPLLILRVPSSEERRLEGARLLQEKRLSQAEIARRLGVSRAAVHQWANRLKSGGVRRLQRRPTPGRPARLTPRQRRRLLTLLKRGALAYGFTTQRWTLARIQQVIKAECSVVYHPHYIGTLLKQWGWSLQHPIEQPRERDDALVVAFLRQEWPRIKKARRRKAEIVFFDVFGFSFSESLGRTWAPKAQPPILRRTTNQRRVVSTAVGLTRSGRIYKRHFRRAVQAQDIVTMLKHFQRHSQKSLINMGSSLNPQSPCR